MRMRGGAPAGGTSRTYTYGGRRDARRALHCTAVDASSDPGGRVGSVSAALVAARTTPLSSDLLSY